MVKLFIINFLLGFAILLVSRSIKNLQQRENFIEISASTLMFVSVVIGIFSSNKPNEIRLLYLQVVLICLFLCLITNKDYVRKNFSYFLILLLLAFILPDFPDWIRKLL